MTLPSIQQLLEQREQQKPTISQLLGEQQGGLPPAIEQKPQETPAQVEKTFTEEVPFGAVGTLPSGEPQYAGDNAWEQYWNGVKARMTEPVTYKADGEYKETEPSAIDIGKRAFGETLGAIGKVLNVGVDLRNAAVSELQTQADFMNPENYAALKNKVQPDVLKANISPVGAAEQFGMATGNQTLPIERIREANKIWYQSNFGTTLLDQSTQKEYMRRVMGGEDPYAVSKELQNNWANLAADIILDPINLIPAGWLTKGKAIEKFADGAKVLPEFVKVLESVAGKPLSGSVDEMAELLAKGYKNLDETIFNITANPMDFTQTAKASQALDKVKTIYGSAALSFKNKPESMKNFLQGLALTQSDNVDKVKEGLRLLDELLPDVDHSLVQLALSKNGVEAARYIKKVMFNEAGEFSSKFAKAMEGDKMLETFGELSEKALKEMYPDVVDVIKTQEKAAKSIAESVSKGIDEAEAIKNLPVEYQKALRFNITPNAKKTALLHDALQKKWGVGKLNQVFSNVYLTSPGFVARNVIMGLAQIAYDYGGSFLKDMGKGNYADTFKGMLGMDSPSVMRRAGVFQEAGKVDQGLNYFKFMKGKAAESEQWMAQAVETKLVKDVLSGLLVEGVSIPKYDALRAADMSDDKVKLLDSLIKKFWGQDDKVMAEFLRQTGGGKLEPYRHIEQLFSEGINDQLKGTLRDDVQKVLDTANTQEEAIQGLNKIYDDLAKKAGVAEDAVMPSYTQTVGELDGKAVEEVGDIAEHLGEESADLFSYQLSVRQQLASSIRRTKEELKIMGFPAKRRGETINMLSPLEDALDVSRKTLEQNKAKALFDVRTLTNQLIGKVDNIDNVIAQARNLPDIGTYMKEFPSDPAVLKDMLWRVYYKPYAGNLYRTGLVKEMENLEQQLIKLGGITKTDLLKSPQYANLQKLFQSYYPVLEAEYIGKRLITNPAKVMLQNGNSAGAIREVASKLLGVGSEKGDAHIISILNKYRGDRIDEVTDLTQVGFEQAAEILGDYAKELGVGSVSVDMKNLGQVILQPPVFGMPPTSGMIARETLDGSRNILVKMVQEVQQKFGNDIYTSANTPREAEELTKFIAELRSKMVYARNKATTIATGGGDHSLLNYVGDRRNIDLAAAYVMPYQFWYSRTYANWLQRFAENPKVINWYGKWREFLEEQNSDLPEYMRNNIRVPLGSDPNNALFFNLEATLNPMNGITGIDFEDKNKIVGEPGSFEYAWTNTLDGIGKYGPSVWTPLSAATAFYLMSKGERDAASRWAGRLLPQTALVKAGAATLGKQLELDPFVNLFSGKEVFKGVDPYEARRIGRSLITMSQEGLITREQAYEAARTQTGDAWDKAVVLATKQRAGTTLSTFMLGQAFKYRTQNDVQIDKFYQDYYLFWQNADKLTPDQTRSYMDSLRQKYPFMDTVILANKDSKERDRAYSYSVLNRIQPAKMTDITKLVGIDPKLVDKFYSEKGSMADWNPNDRASFMAGMVNIGSLLKIPSDATQQEWTRARGLYKQIDPLLQQQFGEDILDRIENYYSLEGNMEDRKQYLMNNPQVQEAMDYRSGLIASTPILSAYYDGMFNLEKFYNGEFRSAVMQKIDPDYYLLASQRDMLYDPAQLAAFEKETNWKAKYKAYNALKKIYDQNKAKALMGFENMLTPAPMEAQDVEPSVGQQNILDYIAEQQAQPQLSWEQIRSEMQIPSILDKAFTGYFVNNRPLTSAENSMLIRFSKAVNDRYGTEFDKEQLLNIISASYGVVQ